ncbi:MAG: low molecular weight phosphotyrosine protein phosphatase [Sneathiellales bacterium]|nr:low molecular weight phosphotyrosine protein phosphatase [Sneathiellales bacterium]
MKKVLFVCLGNICRSPSAEAIFRAEVLNAGLEEKIGTDSAGTGAWHIGNPPDGRAQQAALSRGIDMSDLRARQAEKADFDRFDYIVAMDRSNYENLKRMSSRESRAKLVMMLDFSNETEEEVPDPYYGDMSDYNYVFDLLQPAAKALLDHMCKNDLNG